MQINERNYKLFRVKTLEEFGGYRPNYWSGEGYMDFLYGMPLRDLKCSAFSPKDFKVYSKRDKYTEDRDWYLLYSHVVFIGNETEIEE